MEITHINAPAELNAEQVLEQQLQSIFAAVPDEHAAEVECFARELIEGLAAMSAEIEASDGTALKC